MSNDFKSGFVTIVGRPNVGKSTLMNQVVGEKVAIMSNKPQTTRNRIQSIHTTEEGQIVFIDTPGIHKPQSKLGEYMVKVAENTLNEVDVVLFLVEPDQKPGKGDRYIIEQLEHVKTPVFLVINKIDTVDRDSILEVIAAYKDLYDFKEIVPISAYKGENVDELMKTLYKYMEEGPMYFPGNMITDQPERQIVAEFIREKALHSLQQEIPHGIAVVIEKMVEREDKNLIEINATIICERDSHKRIIIGKQGSMLKKIGSLARRDIEHLLGTKVYLELWVKIKKDWRDSDFLLKNFGYSNGEL
ncbi:GTPase Era [Vallitalea okinawensis]|uniref:GTPase Era n=1 Tax=Vallitalea okinawensis TaxID=2078660 RepID=UPI000CFD1ECD|nr:GTPase Era [Vallitalea okinawensis]